MLNIIVLSAAWTYALFKQVRTVDSKKCDPKADRQFLADGAVVYFRCSVLIILFVHILWQVEMWFVIRTVLITASSFISTRIYSIFKTCCITSATLSTKYHYFVMFSFLVLNNTVFIWMQDHSNNAHQIKHVCQGNMYVSKSKKTPPINKTSAQKNVLLLTAHT